MAAPRVAPQLHRAAPQQFARPSGGAPAAIARHVPTPRTFQAPAQQGQHFVGRNPGSQGGRELRRPNLGLAHQEPSDRTGRNPITQNKPAQRFQLAGVNPSGPVRALRNQFLANRRDGNIGGPALARATFQGRFASQQWRHHRNFRPIVIGWVGPLFWPYAYNDFVDYTFYPHAYDTFWPYAYDDIYEGMFGRYSYAPAYGYAAVGRPPDAGSVRSSGGERTLGTDLCSGQTAGLTDWPIERIAQTVEPNDAQRAALDEIKGATAKALDILKASCPTELPSTPAGRIEAMRARLDAMLQAVRTVRPVLEKFYQSLNDEQKARFNALGPDDNQDQRARGDLAQMCSERASGIGNLPTERIERAVQPNEAQHDALKDLQDAMSKAVNLLKSDCPNYRTLTPVGRLEAMEQRLDAMLRAVQTVQPALEKFYGSLSDEQKERFNRLSPAQG